MGDLLVVVSLMLGAWLAARVLLGDLRGVPADPGGHGPTTSVSVVVPARDEEASLPRLLASLRDLDPPPAEVVVVDDGSRDATAALARAAGATVVAATAPPAGWTGKAWACHLGARTAHGDLLLFLDADVVLAPSALGGLLAMHDRHGGLVSVAPVHTAAGGHEQLSAFFNVVSVLASAAFVARPGRSSMAFGPCLLTSRADYEHAGGHQGVRSTVIEDVALAASYHRAGLPVRCAVGGATVTMRSYPGGLAQLCRGWTKNIASGASAAGRLPLLGAVVWVSAQHAVGLGGVLATIDVLRPDPPTDAWGVLGLWLLAWSAVAWHLRSLVRRVGSFSWWTWAVFPVCLLFFDALFAWSLARTALGRSARWRGRTVDVGPRGSRGPG